MLIFQKWGLFQWDINICIIFSKMTNKQHPLLAIFFTKVDENQEFIFRLMCSHRELTKDRVLKSAYVKIFRTFARNDVNKSV